VTIRSDAISPSRSPRTRGAAAAEDDLGLIDFGARESRVEAGPCPHDAGHVDHGAADPADEVVMPGITRLIKGAPGAGVGDEDEPGADQPPQHAVHRTAQQRLAGCGEGRRQLLGGVVPRVLSQEAQDEKAGRGRP
jgi:hypothetical protein